MNNFHRDQEDKRRENIMSMDRALVLAGLREEGQTVDPTKPCIWTTTGRDGHGKVFQTCTTHGETKVVPE